MTSQEINQRYYLDLTYNATILTSFCRHHRQLEDDTANESVTSGLLPGLDSFADTYFIHFSPDNKNR